MSEYEPTEKTRKIVEQQRRARLNDLKEHAHLPEIKSPVLNIKVDKSEYMDTIEQENSELKARLGMANEKLLQTKAEKALEMAEKLGLEFTSINSPEELQFVEREINLAKRKRNSREIPLSHAEGLSNNPDNENLPLGEKSYPDIPSMMKDLDQLAKSGSKDAQNALTEIAKKELGQLKDYDFEYQGEIMKGGGTWNKKRKVL